MNDWGTLAYDEEHKRWQWHSRYVSAEDAMLSHARRIGDGDRSYLVRMTMPPPHYHRCEPNCACFAEKA